VGGASDRLFIPKLCGLSWAGWILYMGDAMAIKSGSLHERGWKITLAATGFMVIVVEITLAVAFLTHFPSHFEWSFSLFSKFVGQLASMLFAPMPWFVVRRECGQIEKKMLSSGADEADIAYLRKAMGRILRFSCVAAIFCVESLSAL
jgi:hypothetical protein